MKSITKYIFESFDINDWLDKAKNFSDGAFNDDKQPLEVIKELEKLGWKKEPANQKIKGRKYDYKLSGEYKGEKLTLYVQLHYDQYENEPAWEWSNADWSNR